MTLTEISSESVERLRSSGHPLGAVLPELDFEEPRGGMEHASYHGWTTRLGIRTPWDKDPKVYGDELLDLYSWAFSQTLNFDGRAFRPGMICIWKDPQRVKRGQKPWSATIIAVATEHVDRVLHLCPALRVRLYNGTLMFALPSEVEL